MKECCEYDCDRPAAGDLGYPAGHVFVRVDGETLRVKVRRCVLCHEKIAARETRMNGKPPEEQ